MTFKPYYSGPPSDHFDGNRFFLNKKPISHSLQEVLKWRLFGQRQPWPDQVILPEAAHPVARVHDGLKITCVGHATVLIQGNGLNILTDPHFSLRASPVKWIGPRRRKMPGLTLEQLPPIDVIFVSHNHFDHLDLPSLHKVWERDHSLIVTPLGNEKTIRAGKKEMRIQTMDWRDQISLSPDVTVKLLPSRHWSARGIFDTNHALWGAAFFTLGNSSVLFMGDTGFDPHLFLSDHPLEATVALLPIGAYAPQWFMSYAHMSPEEAWETFKILQAEWFIPIHYDVFPLGDEPFGEALVRLQKAAGNEAHRISALEVGESALF